MNTASKLFAMFVLCGASLVPNLAYPQVASTVITDGSSNVYVDADIVRLFTRPPDASGVYTYYVVLSAPVVPSCMTATTPNAINNRSWPVLFSNRNDSKLVREMLQLAFTTGRRVRVYSSQCANFDISNTEYQYPVLRQVEVY